MDNNKYILDLIDQAKKCFELANKNSEEREMWQVPALNYLDAAYILAEYPEPIDFEKEANLPEDATNQEIMEAVFEICGPARLNRSTREIDEYLDEAFDKVWFSRTQVCDIAEVEQKRLEAVKRVVEKYGTDLDVLRDPIHGDWENGYWSGILSALRWVTGEEKDFLDT